MEALTLIELVVTSPFLIKVIMALSKKEKYVAEIIKDEFAKNHNNVNYTEGEDPPDIYLKYDDRKVAIELTELSLNLYKDRISVDKSYEDFIKNIDIEIPDYRDYLVVFHHANIKLNNKISKKIKDFLKNPNPEMEKCIDGIFVKLKPVISKEKIGTISQISLPINSCSSDINTVSKSLRDSNIEYVFQSIINKAIGTKKKKCKDIENPIWLAMHDSYFSYIFSQNKNESIELYKKMMKNIDFGIFEKMIITFNDKEIIVFDKNHNKSFTCWPLTHW